MRISTMIFAVIGAIVLIFGISGANGAPQEAAVAGIAIACAVIPYVIFRCMQIATQQERDAERHQALLVALREKVSS